VNLIFAIFQVMFRFPLHLCGGQTETIAAFQGLILPAHKVLTVVGLSKDAEDSDGVRGNIAGGILSRQNDLTNVK
jgi:hypothetical protein